MSYIYRKEKGVVLLTCLVFLIVILTLLRFVLGSASVQEKKVGADYEQLKASQAASVALRAAELYIIDEDHLEKKPSDNNGIDYVLSTEIVDFWLDDGKVSNLPGVVDASTFDYKGNCDNSPVQDCPFFKWTGDCQASANQPACYENDKKIRYLIERIKAEPKNVGVNEKLQTNVIETKMLMRVTAVGLSDDTNNAVNVIKQNTYVLLKQEEVPIKSDEGKE